MRRRRFRGTEYLRGRATFAELAVAVEQFPSNTAGPDFVLVHGIGVSSRYFHPAAAELARYGRVLLVDLPGYGRAPNPKRAVSLADHARVLAEFLTANDVVNPVLVGHSMGTQVVTQLVLDHPEVTDRIVLMGTTMEPDARNVWRASWRLFRDMLREPPRANVVVLTDYLFRTGIPYYLRQLPNLLQDRIEDRLPRLTARTLVITGDRDPIVSRQWSERVADLAPAGRFVQVEGAHVIMFTDPARVARLIAEHAEGL